MASLKPYFYLISVKKRRTLLKRLQFLIKTPGTAQHLANIIMEQHAMGWQESTNVDKSSLTEVLLHVASIAFPSLSLIDENYNLSNLQNRVYRK